MVSPWWTQVNGSPQSPTFTPDGKRVLCFWEAYLEGHLRQVDLREWDVRTGRLKRKDFWKYAYRDSGIDDVFSISVERLSHLLKARGLKVPIDRFPWNPHL